MAKDYKIVDNFLPKKEFKEYQDYVIRKLPYFFRKGVAYDESDMFCFYHFLYGKDLVLSSQEHFDKVARPLLAKIKIYSLLRIKCNLYTKTEKLFEHNPHTDMPFPHKGFLFYVNTNNGFTILKDGTKIESVANRALFFDSSKDHRSTTCTDEDVRVNVNINYV